MAQAITLQTLGIAFQTNLFATVAAHVTRIKRDRQSLRTLALLDDHLLNDIGLSRADIVRAEVADIWMDRIAMLAGARAQRCADAYADRSST